MELKVGMKVKSYFFFAEREGEITSIETNRYNEVLGPLPDMIFVKFEGDENPTGYFRDQIKFDKPEHWNGHGTFVENF